MTTRKLTKLGLCGALLLGCAATPPRELVDARAAYQSAAGGPAATYDPADLHTAENALAEAETTFKKHGDDARTRDNAYIAMRRAQLADAQARKIKAEGELNAETERHAAAQAAELAAARADLAKGHTDLEAERQAREAAERRALQASADLARIASVKQESRGMVITLSGAVLFPSGKAELLPSAQVKLGEVAKALAEQSPDTTIVVEGHTDSQGSETFNLDLSQKRAEAVREYLGSHGVAPDRIRAEGLGLKRPIADNKSAEGRANNRRVEIVVQPTNTSAPAAPGVVPPKS